MFSESAKSAKSFSFKFTGSVCVEERAQQHQHNSAPQEEKYCIKYFYQTLNNQLLYFWG